MANTHPLCKHYALNNLSLAISTTLALGPIPLLAAPSGGVVVDGQAVIGQSDAVTNITQYTQKAAINWQGFSVGSGETVNFIQPDALSITLNRVVGNERSVIEGALNANGQIFLINSNGVLFTKGSSVNVAGLVASTLDISNEDFNAGRYVFQNGGGSGAVINMGTLSAADGGYVALLGKEVSNQGVIVATRGTAALSAGDRITLNFNGDSLLSVSIDQGTLDALVENRQAIYADGGKVFLTAGAADEVLGSQVNNSGLVQARTLGDLKGEIVAYAQGGTANIGGTLDASAPDGGDGGFIETSGDRVKIDDGAYITTHSVDGETGQWLIDPDGFTIANSGGDVSANFLSSLLAADATNLTVSSVQGSGSDGDLNINDAISWGSNAKLALLATVDINLNAAVTATGDSAGLTLTAGGDVNINNAVTLSGDHAALALNYGGDYNIRTKASYSGTELDADGKPVAKQDTSGGVYGSLTLSGSYSTLKLNDQDYTLIRSMDDFAAISGVTGFYAVANDLDATAWSAAHLGSASVVASFAGTLTGLGHAVSHLTINTANSNAGLIGDATKGRRVTASWAIRDLGVVDADISGTGSVGILAGNTSRVDVTNVYSSGRVQGNNNLGGLIGNFGGGKLSNAFSTADVTDLVGDYAGGLVGFASLNAEIDHVHATGWVNATHSSGKTAGSNSGGLIGYLAESTVSNAYALGNVAGNSASVNLGGLIGNYISSQPSVTIANSFATGDVAGGTVLGGLIGKLAVSGTDNAPVTVENVYATGDITAGYSEDFWTEQGVGGLIGVATLTSGVLKLTGAHAAGDITVLDSYNFSSAGGPNYIGGLIGNLQVKSGDVDNSYATGNIYAPKAYNVGGLFGSANSRGRDGLTLTVNNSYSTGNITGYGFVGGLFGAFYGELYGYYDNTPGAVVNNSYASGSVNGTTWVGGIAGRAGGTVIGPNVYYNGESVQSGVGKSNGGLTDGSTGLTGQQLKDSQYYANGTINQVLADRATTAAKAAAEQAAQQAAAKATTINTASQLGSTRVAEAQRQIASAEAVAISGMSTTRPQPIEDHIVFNDPSNYSAHVRRIEVDGVIYDLDEEEKTEQ